MTLLDLLSRKRNEILSLWFDEVINTYPPETVLFLRKQQNRFTNPVGATIRDGLEGIYNEILGDAAPERLSPFLDNIIRIRAVQDFSPSQAISFVGDLKRIVRDTLPREEMGSSLLDELFALDRRIDELTFLSFDIFVKCREKIYDLKANEARNMTFRLIERLNRLGEAKHDDVELNERTHE